MNGEKIVNGLNVSQVTGTIESIRQQPALGKRLFQATNEWVSGTHSQATVKEFHAGGKEDASRSPVSFDLDEPPTLAGRNQGPNPAEYLLVGLSGCLTRALVTHASIKGIELKDVRSRVEGELELQGVLGISEQVPVGFKKISVFFDIDADISEEKKEDLVRMARKHSPVFHTLSQATPVRVHLEEMAAA
ncbi:MAG: OsmC family protein [Desulfovibrionales bacterium]